MYNGKELTAIFMFHDIYKFLFLTISSLSIHELGYTFYSFLLVTFQTMHINNIKYHVLRHTFMAI